MLHTASLVEPNPYSCANNERYQVGDYEGEISMIFIFGVGVGEVGDAVEATTGGILSL